MPTDNLIVPELIEALEDIRARIVALTRREPDDELLTRRNRRRIAEVDELLDRARCL